MSQLNEENVGGYSVTYSREDTYFPIYVTAAVAAVFLGAAWFTAGWYWLPLAAATAAFTYHNLPMLESGRPIIGANQYGIFIQALGLIRWRAIARIDVVPIADRAMISQQLQITLNAPLGSALVVDWRRQPLYRRLMRRPWWLGHDGVVRVNVEPLDQPAEEIHRSFLRMWRFYRS
ncbi:hypothetical protein [Bradyrhizobium sp. 2TAF24]|uniref:hypothetical protein n=1 Tax=Bradyrhizobium sp. 2TAF24 TaxID=3233011 RepID=UPI003F9215E5